MSSHSFIFIYITISIGIDFKSHIPNLFFTFLFKNLKINIMFSIKSILLSFKFLLSCFTLTNNLFNFCLSLLLNLLHLKFIISTSLNSFLNILSNRSNIIILNSFNSNFKLVILTCAKSKFFHHVQLILNIGIITNINSNITREIRRTININYNNFISCRVYIRTSFTINPSKLTVINICNIITFTEKIETFKTPNTSGHCLRIIRFINSLTCIIFSITEASIIHISCFPSFCFQTLFKIIKHLNIIRNSTRSYFSNRL